MIRDIRIQYFLTYATLGSVLPYASVFFRHAGLSDGQVGCAMAIWSLAAVLSPVIVTMLADRARDPRRLLAAGSLLTALSLVLIARRQSTMLIMSVWTFYCVMSMPVLPLQDGIHFTHERRRLERGEPPRPFHLIRVWGTIGFIVPNLILYRFLRNGMSLSSVMMSGAVWSTLAGIQAFRLHDPGTISSQTPGKLPGLAAPSAMFSAAKALFSPHLIAFTAAVVLMNMTGVVHSGFYPIYLTERVKLSDTWLGPVANVAVFFETFLLFSCGWMVRKIGLKRLLVLAMLAIGLRMALLGLTTNAWVAVGSQVFHGFLVIAISVLPQAIFNDSADDRNRLSMQGVLVMVANTGRAIASLVAGRVAGLSIAMAFNGTAVMCAIAAILVIIGFHERPLKLSTPAGTDDGDDPLLIGAASAMGKDD